MDEVGERGRADEFFCVINLYGFHIMSEAVSMLLDS